jgi:RNA recognition motif-containing protein
MSTATDNLADTLASTTINDTNGTTQADAAAVSVDEGRRLYIGNLAYATTEGELKDFFKSYTM